MSHPTTPKYDVFISFRGEDTRDNFTSHLYEELRKKNIETYVDDYSLKIGDEINSSLVEAIEESLIYVVILSENYASSRWCLEKLTEILKCKDRYGRLVIPVFYKVDPSTVRHQRQSYANHLAKQHQRFGGKVDAWKASLTQVACLSGWDSHATRPESKLVTEIVKDIAKKLNRCVPSLHPFPSGNFGYYFNSTKKASRKIIEALKDDKYYAIGLHGKKGSGKTSLVKAEMNKYEKIFDRVIFPTVSNNQDAKSIQEGIASSLNVHFERDDSDVLRAMKIIMALERKDGTILVILDNFPTKSQPQELGIPFNSRQCKVLLTARDEADCVLMRCDYSISLDPLSNEEALTLLQKLSGVNSQSALFEVAREVASKCNGLPGLIEKVATSLKNKSLENWKQSLVSLSHSTARYQIFISFRGGDTRHVFTNHLHYALCQKGFVTFKDDESLEGGVPIEKLLDDIEESRFAIVILSKNYADSEWCLKELVKILECKDKESKNQLVLPIFYEVPPTDVRHVQNSYADAMAKHVNNGKDSYIVKTWKKALYDICTLTGFEKPHDWTRDQFIDKIVNFACDHRHHLHIQSMYMN